METLETLITDHLDTWSSGIKAKSSAGRGGGKKQEFYGIKKLRELILELAVRGLLVPQDSTEPAALKCLREANSGLLEFKKPLDQAAPSGWLSLPLGCIIASNIGGGTPSKSNPNYWDGDIPWASVKDIQSEKFIDSAIDSITTAGLENSSSNLIPPNRLLIVTRMGLGKLAINKCAMAIVEVKKMEQKGGNIDILRERLHTVMTSTSGIGWGYHDTLSDLYLAAFDKE